MISKAPTITTFNGGTQYGLPASEPSGYLLRQFDGTNYNYYMLGDTLPAVNLGTSPTPFANTVATLPSAATSVGTMLLVNDSVSNTSGTIVVGSGTNKVMVFSDGTNWMVS